MAEQILEEKHTKNTNRLTCQQDNLNLPTFYSTVSYSAQEPSLIWHCHPQACLLYFSIQIAPSQIVKAWLKFLPFHSLIHLLCDLLPSNSNNQSIYSLLNQECQEVDFLSLLDQHTWAKILGTMLDKIKWIKILSNEIFLLTFLHSKNSPSY